MPEKIESPPGEQISNEPGWQARTTGALFAHFLQSDGSSRPGADWSVMLTRGTETHSVTVRAYLADDVTMQVQKNTTYQAQTVLSYIGDLLANGWTPDQDGELVIVIQNPSGADSEQTPKPWWKLW